MYDNIIEATIITGKFKHTDIFRPKIPLVSSSYSFEFRRSQFPIKLSFAMTINKVQGKILKVGLYLKVCCFAHDNYILDVQQLSVKKIYLF